MSYGRVTREVKCILQDIVGSENIYDSPEMLEKHGTDESPLPPHPPEVVVKPITTREVSEVLRLAHKKRIPVTPQGSRTGLSGGAHPVYGGIALSLERMNRILEIDEDNLMVVVEPGVLILDLHTKTEKVGLLYPPDPGEESGSLGGNISTNAGGVRGLKYGVTRDYVQGLEAVLPNGKVIEMGGKIVKSSTGYELIDLLIGSEGTLGVITKAILRLVPKPKYSALLYLPFNTAKDAASAVTEMIRRRVIPFAVEFMPRHSVETAERYLERRLPDNEHEAYLIVGIEGNSEAELEWQMEVVGDVCLQHGALDAYVADTEARIRELWEARKCLFDAYKAFWEIDEVDICVPRSRLPEYMEEAERIGQRHGIVVVNIGHAGDGNVHSTILRPQDMERETWLYKLETLIDELIYLGLRMGGTVSGEHGLGYTKRKYLVERVGSAQVELMRAIKRVFDPRNILNPGKILP